MIVTLKKEAMKDIEENVTFFSEGCACGDFAYKLHENLWITVYRSCRKGSMTDDDKFWQLQDIVFTDKVEFEYFEKDGQRFVDYIDVTGEELENYKLNPSQREWLYEILKRKSTEQWGNEYKNQD